MTTIAWRDGVIASDQQATDEGCACRATKLFNVKGVAIGVAGSLAEGLAFIQWLQGDRKTDCPLGETSALCMDIKSGQCVSWESPGQPIPVEDDFYAVGSGATFAIGAMAMGADAKKAVQIASKFDVYSGFGVKVIKAKSG